ncbi:MAG TPA: phosphoribosylaminoimidazolesuccinocarboxamide synthase [Patescibacteria group bacterium]|nr:phosphoribosylaminoimidazolesuccinocarboxamide synthase [Patescibacteria group bacterium]
MISKKQIIKNVSNVFKTINLPKQFGNKHQGKVRDVYVKGEKRIIITTDRQSAFDKMLGFIPFKGQVLTQLSKFWFDKTKDIIENHLISIPDPNVMIAKECKLIPVEMVVRGYLTGVTSTSTWTAYEKGERIIYGIKFPNGMKKNQKMKKPIITPTTKADIGKHDEKLTRNDILKSRLVPKKLYEQMEKASLALFERGTKICAKAGIILVDSKYEFGLYKDKLTLIDEVHTPDSSRFWKKESYVNKFKQGKEPENFDKEFIRLWFKKRGYSGDGKAPKMPADFVVKVSQRYQKIYEMITNEKFNTEIKKEITKRIKDNLKEII